MLFCSIGICGIYNRIFTIFGIDYRVFNYIVYSICAYKANVKFNDAIIFTELLEFRGSKIGKQWHCEDCKSDF